MVKYVSTYTKRTFKNRSEKTYLTMLIRCFCAYFFLSFLIKVDAIQTGTCNICLYKEVNKKYTGCKLKTTELLDCALKGVCAVIRLNTVCI